jgi:hypothetical protein
MAVPFDGTAMGNFESHDPELALSHGKVESPFTGGSDAMAPGGSGRFIPGDGRLPL